MHANNAEKESASCIVVCRFRVNERTRKDCEFADKKSKRNAKNLQPRPGLERVSERQGGLVYSRDSNFIDGVNTAVVKTHCSVCQLRCTQPSMEHLHVVPCLPALILHLFSIFSSSFSATVRRRAVIPVHHPFARR